MIKRNFILLFLILFFHLCKPTTEDAFDELKRTGTVFKQATFCAENPSLLGSRQMECEQALAESIQKIESILNRQMDLALTKVILPKQTGEEIEQLLRIKTELGIRYFEIWKHSVILE
jgi:hypothetical protein